MSNWGTVRGPAAPVGSARRCRRMIVLVAGILGGLGTPLGLTASAADRRAEDAQAMEFVAVLANNLEPGSLQGTEPWKDAVGDVPALMVAWDPHARGHEVIPGSFSVYLGAGYAVGYVLVPAPGTGVLPTTATMNGGWVDAVVLREVPCDESPTGACDVVTLATPIGEEVDPANIVEPAFPTLVGHPIRHYALISLSLPGGSLPEGRLPTPRDLLDIFEAWGLEGFLAQRFAFLEKGLRSRAGQYVVGSLATAQFVPSQVKPADSREFPYAHEEDDGDEPLARGVRWCYVVAAASPARGKPFTTLCVDEDALDDEEA